MNKLRKIKGLVASVKNSIPPRLKKEVDNIDSFIMGALNEWVGLHVQPGYSDKKIKLIPISDKMGELPSGINSITSIVGCTKTKKQYAQCWQKEVAGLVQTNNDGSCAYTVIKDCDCETDCMHPMVIDMDEWRQQLGPASKYFLMKHYWGYVKDENGNPRSSYIEDFFLMCPTTSNFFGAKGTQVHECLGFKYPGEIGEKWEYRAFDGKIETNFKEGFVLLSYETDALDEGGFCKYPDIKTVVSAMKAYAKWKVLEYIRLVRPTLIAKSDVRDYFSQYQLIEVRSRRDLNPIDFNEIMNIMTKTRYSVLSDYSTNINKESKVELLHEKFVRNAC